MGRWLVVVAVFAWAFAYAYYAEQDEATCAAHGVPFGGETPMLDGFCLYGTVLVPVESYREGE